MYPRRAFDTESENDVGFSDTDEQEYRLRDVQSDVDEDFSDSEEEFYTRHGVAEQDTPRGVAEEFDEEREFYERNSRAEN